SPWGTGGAAINFIDGLCLGTGLGYCSGSIFPAPLCAIPMTSWLPRLSLSLRGHLPGRLRHLLRLARHLVAQGQPSMALPPELLADCRVCASRNELVKNLPRGGRIAEVGTYRGAFARHILAECGPAELHLIDLDFSALDPAVAAD